MRSTSLDSQILRTLRLLDDQDEYQTGAQISHLVAELLHSAPPPSSNLYTSLNRLRLKKLIEVREKTDQRVAGYRLSGSAREEAPSETQPPPWPKGTTLQGHRAEYKIERLYPYRGLGEIYIASVRPIEGVTFEDLVSDKEVMIKVPRVNTSAPEESARYLKIINKALRAEIPRLLGLGHVAAVAPTYDFGVRRLKLSSSHRNEIEAETVFLVQKWFKGSKHLKAYLLENRGIGRDRSGASSAGHAQQFAGVVDVRWWFTLAERLAIALKQVHDSTTAHRDIKPTNIVMHEGKPIFVDLGEAIFGKVRIPGRVAAPSSEEPASARAFMAPEQRDDSGRSPSRRSDLFSLGAVLYYLATGQEPHFEGLHSPEVLKSAIAQALRGTVADDNAGIEDIISRCLRNDPETRVQSASALLQDIRVFSPAGLQDRAVDLHTIIDKVSKKPHNDVFAQLARVEIAVFEETLDSLAAGSVVIEGDHDRIVRRLCAYLATLCSGDTYWTISVPEFWSSENAGVQGRYLSMNLEAARRGAHIHRFMVLTKEDESNPAVHAIVNAQVQLESRVNALRDAGRATGTIATKYVLRTPQEKSVLIDGGEQVGLWIKDDSIVLLRPIYDRMFRMRAVQLSNFEPGHAGVDELLGPYKRDAKPLEFWLMQPEARADETQAGR